MWTLETGSATYHPAVTNTAHQQWSAGSVAPETDKIAALKSYAVAIGINNDVLVSLFTGATPRDELQAFVHATILRSYTTTTRLDDAIAAVPADKSLAHWRMDQSSRIVDELLFGDDDWLMTELRYMGWDVDGRFYLGFSRRRSQWTTLAAAQQQCSDSKKEK